MLFRHFLAGQPLAEPRLHRFQLFHRRAAHGRVARAVLAHQFLHQIRSLQHDAAARRVRRKLAEIAQKSRLPHRLEEAARIANVLDGELDNGARLDAAARADVMADAGGHRTKRLAVVVVVGIDDGDGHLRPRLDHELADADELVRAQSKLRIHLRSDWPVSVIPDVVHAALDEFLQPLFGQQLVHIRLADAGGHSGKKPGTETMFQPAHRFVEHVLLAAALITRDFTAFDADQGRGVAQFAQAIRDFLRDELAVGEKLKVTVGVRGEQVEQLRVHERFAAEDAEERVPVPFGVGDGAIERVQVDGVLLLHIHPAALATEVARVDDGKIEERGEVFAALDAPLELLDRQHPLHAEVPDKLPQATLVGRAQDAAGKSGQHSILALAKQEKRGDGSGNYAENRQHDFYPKSWFPFLNFSFHRVCFVKIACALAFASSDRKSTRLNSSHGYISYAVFCLKKKK